ncbi:MAG: DUF3179 domain-containing protein [Pseudomonadota bacterium]
MPTRRRALAGLAATAAPFALVTTPHKALAAPSEAEIDKAGRDLFFGSRSKFDEALKVFEAHGGPEMAALLIFSLRFSPHANRPIQETLVRVTGTAAPQDWFDWMLWQEKNPEVVPHRSYAGLKRELFLDIDPNFELFLRPEHLERDAMKIRFEEVTWGGVRKDGIPSLDAPEMIAAGEAGYLNDDDLVFGVEIEGDVRAYPLRIMGWHEMFNDVIGGVPVALAYCTLCGAGILFETAVEGRERPFIFGSSGFLYRSNKLMFDRETHSLWNQFTGQPVQGPLVDSGIALGQRPVTIEHWGTWRRRNPGTTVLSLDTGYVRNYGSGVVYNDYFASPDLMFPTRVDQSRAKQKDYVFGIRTFGGAKAWPLKAFDGGKVINDHVAGLNVVLVGDTHGRTVRAYDSQGLDFRAGGDGREVVADGAIWRVTEAALVASDGRKAPRVAGHVAYWFAWDGYLGARSDFYEG